ncbi:protein roadkill [Fusarium longipes]|uniref:Protein roadkill n=1 Tax=Fusarium longipes TaxID=694270 RepID=A0A395T2T0_9HYPO|nr:protein roadkill [Fusarium longipes]
MVPKEEERFLSSLKGYFNNDALSDLTITCDGEEFKVHRLILSGHSTYFAKCLRGEWKESSEGRVNIEDFDASVVEAMLRFMYSFDYDDDSDGSLNMVFNAQVYQIADKYDVQALKAQSKNKFEMAVTTGWNTEDFPLAVIVTYDTTPPEDRGLRDVVVEIARKNIDKLLGCDGFCELIRKTPDFSADLIPFLCTRPTENAMSRYRCPGCSKEFYGQFSEHTNAWGHHFYYYCPYCGQHRADWHINRIDA